MPKVEQYGGPKIQAAPISAPKLTANTSGAFGEALVQGVSDATNTYAKIQKDIQDKDNAAGVKGATTKYRGIVNSLGYTNEDGFYNQKGESAYKGFSGFQKQLEDERKRIMSELPNEEQRRLFGEVSQEYVNRELDSGSRHAAAGRLQWLNDQDSSNILQAQEDGALRYNDNEPYVNQVKSSVANMAKRGGWPKEKREFEERRFLTALHKSALDNILAQKDVEGAKEYYYKNRDEISPTIHDDILKQLEVNNHAVKAQALADEASIFGSEKEARAFGKKNITDPAIRNTFNQLIAQDFSMRDREERRMQADVVNEIDLFKRDNGSVVEWSVKNPNKWASLTPAQRSSLEKTGAIETDWDHYYSIEDLIKSGDVSQESEIRAAAGSINKRDVNALVKEWKNRKKITSTEMRRLYQNYGGKVGTPSKPLNDQQSKNWAGFKEYIFDQLEETGRPENLDDWAAKWFTSGTATDRSWSEAIDDSVWLPFASESPATFGEAVVSGRGDNFSIDLPESADPGEIKQIMKSLNINTDEKDFYWQGIKPATDWLEAHDEVVNSDTISAVLWLNQNGKQVSSDSINYVISRAVASEFDPIQDIPE